MLAVTRLNLVVPPHPNMIPPPPGLDDMARTEKGEDLANSRPTSTRRTSPRIAVSGLVGDGGTRGPSERANLGAGEPSGAGPVVELGAGVVEAVVELDEHVE